MSNHKRIIHRIGTLLANGDVWTTKELRRRLEKDLKLKLREDYLLANLLGHPYMVDCKNKLVMKGTNE